VEARVFGRAAHDLRPHARHHRGFRVEPIALEQGEWQGIEAASGAVEAQGRYCAKWRQVDGQWVIIAEIFVTMA
jgi:hypothetical protein